ncbi:hypothetical protein BJ166DRAFT_605780 [Pestalotiopsis sp. NC0098]|nr:hypothetical protein BJ166DRAFT_605780 [Pestalotiopsis sp. NC0098]
MASVNWVQLPFPLVTPGQVLAAGIVLPIVCTLCVILRFYIRRLQQAPIGVDDWLVAIGVIFITGMGACLITGERLRVFGYPTPVPAGTNVTEAYGLFLDAFILQAKIQFALQFLMSFAYGFVKTSVIFFCRRIFVSHTHKGSPIDWTTKVMTFIAVSWSIGFLMALVFGCGKPVQLHWAPLQTIEESGCDVSTPEVAMVISDLILDLAILILPIPAIWRLSMSTGRKVAVTFIFMFGIMSVAASAARMAIYLIVLYEGYSAGYDINRTASTMLWWSMIEVSLAAIAACLPTFNFLLKDQKLRKRMERLGSFTKSWSSLRLWKTTQTSEKPSVLPLDSLCVPDETSNDRSSTNKGWTAPYVETRTT